MDSVSQRPSLAYHRAFDLCAAWASGLGGPVAVLASSPFYARELLKRLDGPAVLAPLGSWDPQSADGRSGIGSEVRWERVTVVSAGDSLPPCPVAIWAEPQEDVPAPTITPRLIVLTTNRLRRVLPEWQTGALSGSRPLGWAGTVRLLRQAGGRVRRCYGLPGPASLTWGFLARLAAVARRDDLVDRFYAAMRQTMVVEGRAARWTPLALLDVSREE